MTKFFIKKIEMFANQNVKHWVRKITPVILILKLCQFDHLEIASRSRIFKTLERLKKIDPGHVSSLEYVRENKLGFPVLSTTYASDTF